MLSFAINPICQASTLLPPIQAIRKIFFVWLIAIDSCIYIYIYPQFVIAVFTKNRKQTNPKNRSFSVNFGVTLDGLC